ncbi:ABC transporter substrate-binding protein [Mesorhizobium sp. SP-1A]|uniref:ABC transporter substrate-binding protein n=1 Tax=Mesorhizobium sp. SP-1A TaxID=3077840 RepID=UPI0028F6F000|nr:ABC transporter substrate-binding protein [Mesorhizobium sp. SP-1A]
MITRRNLLIGSAAGAAAAVLASRAFAELPPLAKKDKYKVGFAQTESNNPWRLAETKSMQDEAKRLGHQLIYTDAASSAAKQASDVNSMIAQGVDAIFLPPREDKPLVPVILAAKAAGIPVFLIDRDVDHTMAKPGEDYVTFIGSDFIEEATRIGEWLVKNANGKSKIIELEGTTGASAARDRKKGFDDFIAKHPDFKIVASQDGDFTRDKGRQVAETLLQAHPDADIIYAHNDEMALGAIAALEAAGKVAGKDVLIVSIDGEKDGVQAIIDGKIGAICGCSPLFGPKSFATLADYAAGKKIAPFIKNEDHFFDAGNAKKDFALAF